MIGKIAIALLFMCLSFHVGWHIAELTTKIKCTSISTYGEDNLNLTKCKDAPLSPFNVSDYNLSKCERWIHGKGTVSYARLGDTLLFFYLEGLLEYVELDSEENCKTHGYSSVYPRNNIIYTLMRQDYPYKSNFCLISTKYDIDGVSYCSQINKTSDYCVGIVKNITL